MSVTEENVLATGEMNQYVTFCLGEEEYGVDILNVQEIIGITDFTKVPYLPEFIKGVINLRGIVVPVIDLRLRFNLEKAEYNDRTSIIIVKVGERVVGMIVDAVSEVLEIPLNMIDPSPSFGEGVNTEFLQGLGKLEDRLVVLLKIDNLLSEVEMKELQSMPEDVTVEEEKTAGKTEAA